MRNFSGIKKILIIRLGKIGDIIITSSVFDLLKSKYPGIHISLLTLEKNRDVLKYNPNIDEIYFTNKNLSLYILLLRLRRNRYDLLLDLNDDPSSTSTTIRRILRAEQTAGFDFGFHPGPSIKVKQPDKNSTHIIERIATILNGLGLDVQDGELKPSLYTGREEISQVENQLAKSAGSQKIIALNLSAGAPRRYWPAEKWIELVNKIAAKFPAFMFLPLSTEADKESRQIISGAIPSSRLIIQDFNSFQHYASYLRKSDLIITADTSAVHIASAFNKPQIVLFPSVQWNFVSWQPLSENSRSIRSDGEDISSISVEQVFREIEELVPGLEGRY